jgi:hypothetical protein
MKKYKGEPVNVERITLEMANKIQDAIDSEAKALMVENILAGEAVVEDFGGYEESTREKYEAFVTQRNYHYTNTDNPVDFPNEILRNSGND